MSSEISWEELEAKLQGSVMLIGLTFVDVDENLVEQFQTHGVFEEFSEDGLMRIKRDDGSIFQMPYEPEMIQAAAPGEYRERSSGKVIVDPDFLVRWTITVKDNAGLAEIKQHGFLPAE